MKRLLLSDAASWTSHTVVVVDHSGSMRTRDASAAGTSRSDAVWTTLATSLIKQQLVERGAAAERDVVSVVLMGQEAEVIVDKDPLDWLLYNRVVRMVKDARPAKAGNFLPALDVAEQLLLSNPHGSCALMLVFLSDGRPSDALPKGGGGGSVFDKLGALMGDRVGALSKRFGRRLAVGTIGFSGASTEDFAVLRQMAVACGEFGGRGSFQHADLDDAALQMAVKTLTQTLTVSRSALAAEAGVCRRGLWAGATLRHRFEEPHSPPWLGTPPFQVSKTEMTVMCGNMSRQRTVRIVEREPRDALRSLAAAPSAVNPREWLWIREDEVVDRKRWDIAARRLVEVPKFNHPLATGVSMKKKVFGEGAERMVHDFREVGADGLSFVGPEYVAKESRFIEDLERFSRRARTVEEEAVAARNAARAKSFHKIFCVTQGRAQTLAIEFNRRLDLLGVGAARVPRVQFLACSTYSVKDSKHGMLEFLVEEKMDPTRFRKYNNNDVRLMALGDSGPAIQACSLQA